MLHEKDIGIGTYQFWGREERDRRTCEQEGVGEEGGGAVGRPRHLKPEEEDKLIEYVEALRDAGVVVSGRLVAAAATGVVQTFRPAVLKQNGGSLEFCERWGWAQERAWGIHLMDISYQLFGLRESPHRPAASGQSRPKGRPRGSTYFKAKHPFPKPSSRSAAGGGAAVRRARGTSTSTTTRP